MPAENFGVREFVNLALFFINYYNRHKDNIDDAVGPTVAASLNTLAAAVDAIKALNAFGPL